MPLIQLNKIEVYVINLDASRNRWIQCIRHISSIFSPSNIHRVPAIEGKSMASANGKSEWDSCYLNKLKREKYISEHLTPDPIRTAVCLSHQRALRMFLQQIPLEKEDESWALILEDDVLPAHELLAYPSNDISINLPDDAELLFLHDRVITNDTGYTLTTSPPDSITIHWQPVTGGVGLEAYLISKAGAEKMLKAWLPLIMECDIQLMAFLRDAANSRLHEKILSQWHSQNLSSPPTATDLINAYAPRRPLIQIDQQLQSDKLQRLEIAEPFKSKAHSRSKDFDLNHRSNLAFATAWFNPCHYRSRLENFLRFYDSLKGCNIVIVELAFGSDDWQLPDDLPNLVRLRSDTVCWQKEAMLNHGLSLLHEFNFPYLGWIDADIIFECDHWQQSLQDALQKNKLCQVFETVNTAFPDRGHEQLKGAAARWIDHGANPLKCSVTGFGWAMHREVWSAARLFDTNVLGGGDHIMWRSIFHGSMPPELPVFGDRTTSPQHALYRDEWARNWASAVQLQVGYARDVCIQSLPHGDARSRKYVSRNEILKTANFAPQEHVKKDTHGLLQWTQATPKLIASAAREYFVSRQEDL